MLRVLATLPGGGILVQGLVQVLIVVNGMYLFDLGLHLQPLHLQQVHRLAVPVVFDTAPLFLRTVLRDEQLDLLFYLGLVE